MPSSVMRILFAALVAFSLLVLPVVQAQWTGNLLNTATSGFTLDGDGMGFITIALTRQPVCNGILYLQSDQADLDRCMLMFTQDNYTEPQSVKVASKQFLNSYNISITAKYVGCAGDDQYGREFIIPLVGAQSASAVCTVSGDPHYITFDGTAANVLTYMGIGDFYLVKSDVLTIQARQWQCMGQATCVYSLAMRYGDAVWILNPNSGVTDVRSNLQWVSRNNGVIATLIKADFNSFSFSLAGGTTIRADIHYINANKGSYMDVQVALAGHLKHRVMGLCGTFDGNPANDYMGADGHIYSGDVVRAQVAADGYGVAPGFNQSQLGLYGNSWRVPDEDNLFKCGANCVSVQPSVFNTRLNHCRYPVIPVTPPAPKTTTTTTTVAATATETPCLHPPPVIVDNTPHGHYVIQGADHDGVDVIPPRPIQPPHIRDADLQTAIDGCTTMITGTPACARFSSLSSLIDLCKVDMRGSRAADPSVVYRTYNLAYATACARGLRLHKSHPSKAVAATAAKHERDHGFGDHPCDKQCNVCSDRGCLQCFDPNNWHVNAGKCVQIPTQ
ncbi:hypothetical protein RI367_003439 [Sorochytrium milnesiophthora]